MNTDEIFDPYEDPEDTIDTEALPIKQRVRKVIADIMNKRRTIMVIKPPIKRSSPGICYMKSGPGTSESRTVWMDSKILYNPVFKYAICKQEGWRPWRPLSTPSDEFEEWNKMYPGINRLGGIALLNDNEDDDYQDCDVLHLVQFDDYESLERFKLGSNYIPMHNVVPVPATKTDYIFEDSLQAQHRGWLKLFENTDFSETEVMGIAENYKNFEKMEMLFLGDRKALRNCYTTIGGKIAVSWLSYNLAKTYKERVYSL